MKVVRTQISKALYPGDSVPCDAYIYFMDTGHAAIIYQGGRRTYRAKRSDGGIGKWLDSSSKYARQMDLAIEAFVAEIFNL